MNGLDLFSGIGGISLALKPWVKTVAYCERDKYAQAVLLSRMAEGKIDKAPIWDDVTTLDGRQFRGNVDIIFGGFPCQDISSAGKQKGMGAERSGLFFEIMRLAEEIKPSFIFLENVAAIRTKGLDRVVWELSRLRYDCRWGMLSAFDVGAPHKRERWFCLAHSKSERVGRKVGNICETDRRSGGALLREPDGTSENVANADDSRRMQQRWSVTDESELSSIKCDGWWESEPDVGRVVNGLPKRVDRLRTLGNAVVPAQAREAFMRLMGL
jgi:DNA (cytosine-5)-methyltransferase 1